MDGRSLVAAVHEAARKHNKTWEARVPDQFTVNLHAEDAEEVAYGEMAEAKRRLRDHICDTYGLTLRQLSSLAAR